jgi:hypothetical protein
MKLTTNFSLAEFTTSETAMKNGFAEQYQPTKEIVDNLRKLAQHLAEPIRAKFGSFSPTVAYRCERLNNAVKGAKKSEHLQGKAFDETFIKDGVNISGEVFKWLLKSGLQWSKLIWEFGDENNPRWLHIGYDEKNLKNEVLVAVKFKNGQVRYIDYFASELKQKHEKT